MIKATINDCSRSLQFTVGIKSKTNGNIAVLVEQEAISLSPDYKYAVIQICKKEVYVCVKIISQDVDTIVSKYVDHCVFLDDLTVFEEVSVDWTYSGYGFCKIILWAPERVNEFGGSFSKTICRFYFNRALYEQKYEEINGVPYKSKRTT